MATGQGGGKATEKRKREVKAMERTWIGGRGCRETAEMKRRRIELRSDGGSKTTATAEAKTWLIRNGRSKMSATTSARQQKLHGGSKNLDWGQQWRRRYVSNGGGMQLDWIDGNDGG